MTRMPIGRALALLVPVIAFAVLVPVAAADSVYHTEHLRLSPVGNAPLRSGFVQNIKAQGPTIYAHEVYVLNGSIPNATYRVSNDFYIGDPECDDGDLFSTETAVMTTGAGGNARADIFFVPAEAEGFEGVHGVTWTVRNATGNLVYQTTCTAVTLD